MKKRSILFFTAFSAIAFLGASLLTILLFNIYPEKGTWIWFLSPGMGAVIGLLIFPTFKKLVVKE